MFGRHLWRFSVKIASQTEAREEPMVIGSLAFHNALRWRHLFTLCRLIWLSLWLAELIPKVASMVYLTFTRENHFATRFVQSNEKPWMVIFLEIGLLHLKYSLPEFFKLSFNYCLTNAHKLCLLAYLNAISEHLPIKRRAVETQIKVKVGTFSTTTDNTSMSSQ